MFNKSGSFVYAAAFALIGVAILGEQKFGAFFLFAVAIAFFVDGVRSRKKGRDEREKDSGLSAQ